MLASLHIFPPRAFYLFFIDPFQDLLTIFGTVEHKKSRSGSSLIESACGLQEDKTIMIYDGLLSTGLSKPFDHF
jgi:hypothetical protein